MFELTLWFGRKEERDLVEGHCPAATSNCFLCLRLWLGRVYSRDFVIVVLIIVRVLEGFRQTNTR